MEGGKGGDSDSQADASASDALASENGGVRSKKTGGKPGGAPGGQSVGAVRSGVEGESKAKRRKSESSRRQSVPGNLYIRMCMFLGGDAFLAGGGGPCLWSEEMNAFSFQAEVDGSPPVVVFELIRRVSQLLKIGCLSHSICHEALNELF